MGDARLSQATTVLEGKGYRAWVAANIKDSYGYLAGNSDESRAAAFERVFADKQISGIICARGGYGAMRILPLINWAIVRDNPKFFCGFSDITALHVAIRKEAGFVTYHGGPMPRWPDNDAANIWNDEGFFKALSLGGKVGTVSGAPGLPAVETLVPGVAEGILEGGNLTLLASLCGTRWQIDLRDKLLLLEDVSEAPYRIDRSLTQLALCGALAGVKGIVFGHSPTCEKSGDDEGFTLREVIMDRLGSLGVPLIYGFPCGHSEYRATLPLGVPARLDATNGSLSF